MGSWMPLVSMEEPGAIIPRATGENFIVEEKAAIEEYKTIVERKEKRQRRRKVTVAAQVIYHFL